MFIKWKTISICPRSLSHRRGFCEIRGFHKDAGENSYLLRIDVLSVGVSRSLEKAQCFRNVGNQSVTISLARRPDSAGSYFILSTISVCTSHFIQTQIKRRSAVVSVVKNFISLTVNLLEVSSSLKLPYR